MAKFNPIVKSFSMQKLFEKLFLDVALRQDVKLLPLESIPKGLKYKMGNKAGKQLKKRFVQYITPMVAAADGDPEEVEESRLKEMTDPYTKDTRKEFTTCAYTDPTLSPSLENRNNAFFQNGFELELELRTTVDATGKPMDETQIKAELDKQMTVFGAPLQRLRDWVVEKDVALLEKMKASHIGCIVQGRSVTLMTPPITLLQTNELPFSLVIMATEELLTPIVDTQRRKLVAVKLDTKTKKVALLDEMIYCVRKQWGLRKDSLFYGASALEPVITSSKAYKRVVNFDLPKAAVAGYITKLLLKASPVGEPDQQSSQLGSILADLVDEGTDIVGMNSDVDVTPVQTKVDTPVLDLLLRKYEEILMSAGGSTMAQLGKTANLNRDTATIMEITHMNYVRTPDEELIKTFFETQLLTPLLRHLVGVQQDEEGNFLQDIPVRVKIMRKAKVDEVTLLTEPGDEGTDTSDTRLEEKKGELETGKIKQTDVEDPDAGA